MYFQRTTRFVYPFRRPYPLRPIRRTHAGCGLLLFLTIILSLGHKFFGLLAMLFLAWMVENPIPLIIAFMAVSISGLLAIALWGCLNDSGRDREI
jgi:hypothetical protein